MEQKPIHFDGSVPIESATNAQAVATETVQITDEARQRIGSNPYIFELNQ